jgi:hypothetical protein
MSYIKFLHQSLNIIRLRRRGARNINAYDAICLRAKRSYARGSSFAHFGSMIPERSTVKELIAMTGTDDVKA